MSDFQGIALVVTAAFVIALFGRIHEQQRSTIKRQRITIENQKQTIDQQVRAIATLQAQLAAVHTSNFIQALADQVLDAAPDLTQPAAVEEWLREP